MKNLLKSAAMLCLSVCMFSLYGCSNEDSPTNSDGSFEGLDVTNLKRGDVVGAKYVKNEAEAIRIAQDILKSHKIPIPRAEWM